MMAQFTIKSKTPIISGFRGIYNNWQLGNVLGLEILNNNNWIKLLYRLTNDSIYSIMIVLRANILIILGEITMPSLQSAFIDFHNKIKLDDENEVLRSKRKILLDKLKNKITDDAASYTTFNQGSYAMHTGIHPADDDYDIDVGIKFDIDKDDYADPVKVKKWVKDALDGHTKKVEIRRSCVTVQYQQDNEPLYHVDFAIYAADNRDGKLYIAKGKENSLPENRFWELSDPQGLISVIADRFTEKDGEQFRRVIRYFKKWKDQQFSSTGSSAPTGIALTVLAYHLFNPVSTYDVVSNTASYNDFDAFKNLSNSIQSAFTYCYEVNSNEHYHKISSKLPVDPGNDLFDKMTAKQMEAFYGKVQTLISKLNEADEKSKLSEKCTVLSEIFGDDFPIKSQRSMVGSTESA